MFPPVKNVLKVLTYYCTILRFCQDFFALFVLQKVQSTRSVPPRQGMLSMQWKAPQRGRFYVLFASTKRTKSSPEGCDPLDSGDGSKLYRLYFFVTFPTLVPKPVCGATRFFGCFEPVRKGYCSADARLLFFEKGLLYCKLTAANVFKEGGCTLSLLR